MVTMLVELALALLAAGPALPCMLRVIQCGEGRGVAGSPGEGQGAAGTTACTCIRPPLPSTIHDIMQAATSPKGPPPGPAIRLDNCTAEHYHIKLSLDEDSMVETVTLRNLRSSRVTIDGWLARNVSVHIISDDPTVKNTLRKTEIQGKLKCAESPAHSQLRLRVSGADRVAFRSFFFKDPLAGCSVAVHVDGESQVDMEESRLKTSVTSSMESSYCRWEGEAVDCSELFIQRELQPDRTLKVVVASITALGMVAVCVICLKNPKKL